MRQILGIFGLNNPLFRVFGIAMVIHGRPASEIDGIGGVFLMFFAHFSGFSRLVDFQVADGSLQIDP